MIPLGVVAELAVNECQPPILNLLVTIPLMRSKVLQVYSKVKRQLFFTCFFLYLGSAEQLEIASLKKELSSLRGELTQFNDEGIMKKVIEAAIAKLHPERNLQANEELLSNYVKENHLCD